MNTFVVVVLAAVAAFASAGGLVGYGGYGLGYGGYGLGYGGYGVGHGYGIGKAVIAAPVAVAHKAVGHSSRYEVRGHGGVVGYAARPVAVGYGHGYGLAAPVVAGYGLGHGIGGYGYGHGYGYHG